VQAKVVVTGARPLKVEVVTSAVVLVTVFLAADMQFSQCMGEVFKVAKMP
jgi:hypothetical protein